MRRTPLQLVPPPDRSSEPGYREWHAPAWGCCSVCGERGRLERHHVVKEQDVRREGGEPWELDNSLLVGVHCRCHRQHTSAAVKIPASRIPAEAIEFAIALLGAGPAERYIERYYSPA